MINLADFQSQDELFRRIATLAASTLIQSTLLIAFGMFAAKMLRSHGAAIQSAVLRATLVAVLACPLASWILAQTGIAGLGIELPRASIVLAPGPQRDPKSLTASDSRMTRPGDLARPGDIARSGDLARSGTSATLLSARQSQPSPAGRNAPEENTPSIEAATLNAAQSAPSASEVARRNLAHTPLPRSEKQSENLLGLFYRVAGYAWICFAALLLGRMVIANLIVLRNRSVAARAEESVVSFCDHLAKLIGVASPAIHCSDHTKSPCLVGVFHPAILLPTGSGSVGRDVLIHELAHLRRRDCGWQMVSCLSTAVLWFQPLMWLLSRSLEQAADDVADDFVLQYGTDRAEYARQLVDFAERYQPAWSNACVGVGILSLQSSLGKRVTRILDTSRSLSTRTGLAVLLAIVLLGVTGTMLIGLLGAGPALAQQRPSQRAADSRSASTADQAQDAGDVKRVTYRGQLLSPDGKPVLGGKIHFVSAMSSAGGPSGDEVQAITDADGNFEFAIKPSGESEQFSPVIRRMGTVFAYADGFGPAAVNVHDTEPGKELRLRLVRDDVPVAGRIVDLQGHPISGVHVKVNAVKLPLSEKGGIAAWRDAIETRRDGMKIEREYFSLAILPASIRDLETETDAEGRFRINGLGQDRIVAVIVDGPTIQSQEFNIVTASGISAVSAPWYKDAPNLGTLNYHAAGTDLVVGPTRKVVGVVRDQATGKPLSGFRVAGPTIGNPMEPVDTVTDGEGRFLLTGLAVGKKQPLTVSPPDDQPYIEVAQTIHLISGDKPLEVMFHAPRGVWVEGKVIHQQTGDPAGATLTYYAASANEAVKQMKAGSLPNRHGQIRTKTNGEFRVAVFPGKGIIAARGFKDTYLMGVGRSKITVTGDDQFFRTVPFLCAPSNYHTLKEVNPAADDQAVEITIALDSGLRSAGRVLDANGRPLVGTLVRGTKPMSYWRKIDSSEFEAIGMLEGKPRQLLFWNEERNSAGRLIIEPNQTDATVRLEPAGALTARLLDKDGAPWPGAEIVSYNHGLNQTSDIEHDFVSVPQRIDVMTDEKGYFRIPSLVPGLKYSFAVKRGPRRKICIKDAVTQPGQLLDLGDVSPLPGPHDSAANEPSNKNAEAKAQRENLKSSRPNNRIGGQRVRGIVLDSKGKPVRGADLYLVWMADRTEADRRRATSGDDGRFDFRHPFTEKLEAMEPRRRMIGTLAVTAKGYGIGFADMRSVDLGEPIEVRLPDEHPISARIVDLQGQPITGANVQFRSLQHPKSRQGGIEAWRKAIETRAEGLAREREYFVRAFLPPALKPKPTTTDSDGMFRWSGFGRDSIVSVIVAGHAIESNTIQIIGRDEMETITAPWYTDWASGGTLRYYANGADHVAAPTRHVVGTITDPQTGQPLMGARVSGPMPGNPSELVVATTDKEGKFRLEGLSVGKRQTLTFTPAEDSEQPFVKVTKAIRLRRADRPLVTELALPRGAWAEGKVTDKRTGKPVRAGILYFALESNDHYQKLEGMELPTDRSGVNTAADGSFRIAVLPGRGILATRAHQDEYLMGIGADKLHASGGRYLATAPYHCETDAFHSLVAINPKFGDIKVNANVQLEPGLRTTARIVDQHGNPLRGTYVRGTRESAYWTRCEEPEIQIFGIGDGKSRQLLFYHEPTHRSGRIVIKANAQNVTVRLQPAGKITGRLLDEDGVPWPNAEIHSMGSNVNRSSGIEHDFSGLPTTVKIYSDDQARFQVSGLVPGLKYALGTKIGFAHVACVDGVSTEAGQTVDIGDIRARSSLEEFPDKAKMKVMESNPRASGDASTKNRRGQ